MRPMEITLFGRLRLFLRRVRHGIVFFIGKHRKPRETAFRMYGREPKNYPVCPRCGELVYCKTQCVMCGQRFKGSVITVGEVMDNAIYD